MSKLSQKEEDRPENDPAMNVRGSTKEAGPPAKRQKTDNEKSDSAPVDELPILPTKDVKDVILTVNVEEEAIDKIPFLAGTQEQFYQHVREMSLEARTAVETLILNIQTPPSPQIETDFVEPVPVQQEAQEPVAGPSGLCMPFYNSMPHEYHGTSSFDYTCKGEYALEEALAAALGNSVPLPDSQVEEPILDSTACYQELEAGFDLKNFEDGGDSNPPSVECLDNVAKLQSELYDLCQRTFINPEPNILSVDDLQAEFTSQPSVDEPAVPGVPNNLPIAENLTVPLTGYYTPASHSPLFIGEPVACEVAEQSAVAFPNSGNIAPTGEVAVIDEPAAVAVPVPPDYVPANELMAMREHREPVLADYIPAAEVLIMGEPQGDYDPSEEAPIMGQPTAVAVPDHGNYVPADELLSMDDPDDFISQVLGPISEPQVSMPLFADQVAGPSRPLRAHAVQLYQRGGVGEPHTCFITSFPRVNLEPDETAHDGPMAAAARASNMLEELLGPGEEDEGEVPQTAAALLSGDGRLDTIAEALRSAAISFTAIDMEDAETRAMQREPVSSGSESASPDPAPAAVDYIVNGMPNDVAHNYEIPGIPEIAAHEDINIIDNYDSVDTDGSIPSDISDYREIEHIDDNIEIAVMNNSPTKKDADADVTTTNLAADTDVTTTEAVVDTDVETKKTANEQDVTTTTTAINAASDKNVAVVAADTEQNINITTPPLDMDAAKDKSKIALEPTPLETVVAADELVTAPAPTSEAVFAADGSSNVPETTPLETVVAADEVVTAPEPTSETVFAADGSSNFPETTPLETVVAADVVVTAPEPTSETVFAADGSSNVPETRPFQTVFAADETTSAPETTPIVTVSATEEFALSTANIEAVSATDESTVSATNTETVSVGIVSTAATTPLVPQSATLKSSAVTVDATCDDTSTKMKAKPTEDDLPPSCKSNRRKRAAKSKTSGAERKTTPMVLRSSLRK